MKTSPFDRGYKKDPPKKGGLGKRKRIKRGANYGQQQIYHNIPSNTKFSG
jgi:hypothetical protein